MSSSSILMSDPSSVLLNPMDPSQMVDQLTQINSLQQLIQIQSDLQSLMGTSPDATSQTTPTSGS
jgi:flagellar hook assembly protein FlgD